MYEPEYMSVAGAVFIGSVVGMLTMGRAPYDSMSVACADPTEKPVLFAGTWEMYWASDQLWLAT